MGTSFRAFAAANEAAQVVSTAQTELVSTIKGSRFAARFGQPVSGWA